MTDKHIIIKGKNKTVQEILQSFVGLPATLANKERLLNERQCFLDKYFYKKNERKLRNFSSKMNFI